jgi:hypothetical protein
MVTGEKTEEFRDTGFPWRNKWIHSRLFEWNPESDNEDGYDVRQYDAVEFTNGYGKDKPRFTAEFKGVEYVEHVERGYSNGLTIDRWGQYAIKLGKILSIENYELPDPKKP